MEKQLKRCPECEGAGMIVELDTNEFQFCPVCDELVKQFMEMLDSHRIKNRGIENG